MALDPEVLRRPVRAWTVALAAAGCTSAPTADPPAPSGPSPVALPVRETPVLEASVVAHRRGSIALVRTFRGLHLEADGEFVPIDARGLPRRDQQLPRAEPVEGVHARDWLIGFGGDPARPGWAWFRSQMSEDPISPYYFARHELAPGGWRVRPTETDLRLPFFAAIVQRGDQALAVMGQLVGSHRPVGDVMIGPTEIVDDEARLPHFERLQAHAANRALPSFVLLAGPRAPAVPAVPAEWAVYTAAATPSGAVHGLAQARSDPWSVAHLYWSPGGTRPVARALPEFGRVAPRDEGVSVLEDVFLDAPPRIAAFGETVVVYGASVPAKGEQAEPVPYLAVGSGAELHALPPIVPRDEESEPREIVSVARSPAGELFVVETTDSLPGRLLRWRASDSWSALRLPAVTFPEDGPLWAWSVDAGRFVHLHSTEAGPIEPLPVALDWYDDALWVTAAAGPAYLGVVPSSEFDMARTVVFRSGPLGGSLELPDRPSVVRAWSQVRVPGLCFSAGGIEIVEFDLGPADRPQALSRLREALLVHGPPLTDARSDARLVQLYVGGSPGGPRFVATAHVVSPAAAEALRIRVEALAPGARIDCAPRSLVRHILDVEER